MEERGCLLASLKINGESSGLQKALAGFLAASPPREGFIPAASSEPASAFFSSAVATLIGFHWASQQPAASSVFSAGGWTPSFEIPPWGGGLILVMRKSHGREVGPQARVHAACHPHTPAVNPC